MNLCISAECNKRLESGNANLQDEDLYCNNCQRKLFSAPPPSKESTETYVNKEDLDCCPRCGKRVYFAEQVAYLQRKWHNTCFSCGEFEDLLINLDFDQIIMHIYPNYCKEIH